MSKNKKFLDGSLSYTSEGIEYPKLQMLAIKRLVVKVVAVLAVLLAIGYVIFK